MQRLNLEGTVMLGDEECFHFTIVNDVCIEFTPASNHVTRYPFGCDPSKFPNYKENVVLFFTIDQPLLPGKGFIKSYRKSV